MRGAGWRRFRRLFGPDPDGDVDDELSFHLEMRARDLERRGETPERARDLAMMRFGDYESSRSACVEIDERRIRTMARSEWFSELRRDLAYAARTLRRTPGFTVAAAASLALGIGATSAIFTVVHGVLLQPLPFPAAERLHEVRTLYPDGTGYPLSAPDFMSVRQDNRVFEQVEAYAGGTATLLGVGEPREIRGARVSDGLYGLLGFRTIVGRGFRPEEHEPGRARVAMLDHGFWQREFGGDPAVLTRSFSVAGAPYTIVGVLAPGSGVLEGADMYTTLEYDQTFSAATATARRSEYLRVLARARPGLTRDQLERDMRRVGTELQAAFPATNAQQTFGASPLHEVVIGDVRRPLLVLLGSVGFVLLVACANVANLLLARTSARREELAVRAALGAGRGRLVRQLLTESVLLGLVGAAAGLLVAYWGTAALVRAQPADIPRIEGIGVGAAVVAFTLVLALLSGLAFGVLPALQATGRRMTGALREGGRGGGAGGGGHRVRSGLVVAEMALAVVLLTGAGLLIRSFIELAGVDPGFRREQAMAVRLVLQGERYGSAGQIRSQVDALLERLRGLPNVTAVGATTVLPLSGRGSLIDFAVGNAPPPPNVNAEIGIASVTPDYLRAVGTPLLRGRGLGAQDDTGTTRVVLINEAGVRLWFPGEDPVGKRVTAGIEREIVGIVGDVLQRDPGQPALPMLYAPFSQRTTRTVQIVVRSSGDPLLLGPAVRTEIRALDPNLPLAELVPLGDLVTSAMARPRFYTSLLALFAGVALALAAIGIFGVLSYAVAQRSREIAIRLALGAPAGGVMRMIVARAMLLAAAGIAVGIAAAVALGRLLRSQLFGVSEMDPATLGAVVVVLVASAAAASLIPARRAATVDPMSALREG